MSPTLSKDKLTAMSMLLGAFVPVFRRSVVGFRNSVEEPEQRAGRDINEKLEFSIVDSS